MSHPFVEHARAVIAERTAGNAAPRADFTEPFDDPQGLFVTLHTSDKRLRGCIGHIGSIAHNFSETLTEMAEAAAMRDSRFAQVDPQEVADLVIDVSVLRPPEPVTDRSTLDARRFGVLVKHAGRRGILLPDIEGVDLPAEQISIALDKAGIRADAPYDLFRFEVEKFE